MLWEFNVYELLTNILANPGDFGLTNVTESALDTDTGQVVDNPEEYLFWDGVHPTTSGHQILANHIPEPASITLLAGGWILIAILRRRRLMSLSSKRRLS